MALCKPIVSFDLNEARFSAMDSAIYARPNDVLDFAQKVVLLMDHPEDRQKMGSFGLQRVASELAWEFSIPELLQAYSKLMEKKQIVITPMDPGRNNQSI